MAHSYQFVDSISASPDVLLDLDDLDPFWVAADSSVSPPKLRRSTAQGLADGTIETGTSYDDRTIQLKLGVELVAAETQATAIQTLARLLNRRDGAWLRWQSEGMDEPRFYRTKRADVDVIDEILDAKPDRTINLEIPAHPFGYGLPETGEFTITNNPLVGDNPMMYTFGEILGDVMTPLHLTFPTPDGGHSISWASQATFDGTTLLAPYYQSLTAPPKNASPPAGWTITNSSDSLMVSGAKRFIAKFSTLTAEVMVPTAATMLQWPDLPPGDYRVFVRLGAAAPGFSLYFWNRPPSTGSVLIPDEAAATYRVDLLDFDHDWISMGIVAMPGGAPISDPAFGLDGDPVTALWNLGVGSPSSGVGIELDAIVLVPAVRPNTLTRHGSVTFPVTQTDRIVTLDGINKRRYAHGESVNAAGITTVLPPSGLSGALPVVVPGAANTLTFFATTAIGDSDIDDDKTLTTDVEYKYFPRYVYERPALT